MFLFPLYSTSYNINNNTNIRGYKLTILTEIIVYRYWYSYVCVLDIHLRIACCSRGCSKNIYLTHGTYINLYFFWSRYDLSCPFETIQKYFKIIIVNVIKWLTWLLTIRKRFKILLFFNLFHWMYIYIWIIIEQTFFD